MYFSFLFLFLKDAENSERAPIFVQWLDCVWQLLNQMPVAFIATNHTTGGNSGSPALDAKGNLIGLNFDRVWEGTMSDIYYSPEICRNIMVDIRYVLFIIDKFAGAENLIKELKIIAPKK